MFYVYLFFTYFHMFWCFWCGCMCSSRLCFFGGLCTWKPCAVLQFFCMSYVMPCVFFWGSEEQQSQWRDVDTPHEYYVLHGCAGDEDVRWGYDFYVVNARCERHWLERFRATGKNVTKIYQDFDSHILIHIWTQITPVILIIYNPLISLHDFRARDQGKAFEDFKFSNVFNVWRCRNVSDHLRPDISPGQKCLRMLGQKCLGMSGLKWSEDYLEFAHTSQWPVIRWSITLARSPIAELHCSVKRCGFWKRCAISNAMSRFA